jgi:glycosyltransferase involved in cell wall biosynthesis
VRILQINNLYRRRGGEEISAEREAALLADAGHEVARHLVRNPDHPARAARALATAPWNREQARMVKERVRAFRPDLAHVHNTWFAISPSVIHALHVERVPIVVSLHNYRLLCANALLFRNGRPSTDCVGSHPWWGVVHRCYRGSTAASAISAATIALHRARRTWDLVDLFIAPSRFVKDIFVSAGFLPERLIVRPHAVRDPGRRDEPPSSSRTALYVGRLAEQKGIGILLEAWDQLATELPNLELAVAGDGPLRKQLEARASDRLRVLGWVDGEGVTGLMRTGRALVVPSQSYEAFGLVAAEAFAAGLPVLSTDLGGAAEVADSLGREWLVSGADRDSWARGLRRLADDLTVDSAGARAREIFERNDSFEVGLRSLLKVYESALVRAG